VALWLAPLGGGLSLAALALVPAAACGAIFGSPGVILVALALAALALRARPALAGVALGIAAVLSPRLLLAAPLLLPWRPRGRALIATLVTFAAGVALSVTLGGPGSAPLRLEPSLGLPNLMLYAGGSTLPRWIPPVLLLLNLAALGALTWIHRRHPEPAPAEAACFLLASLWLSPAATPHDLALPLALLAVALIDIDIDAAPSPGRLQPGRVLAQ